MTSHDRDAADLRHYSSDLLTAWEERIARYARIAEQNRAAAQLRTEAIARTDRFLADQKRRLAAAPNGGQGECGRESAQKPDVRTPPGGYKTPE